MNGENQTQGMGPQEDEIDLGELINVIAKRKKMIMAICGISVAVAVVISLLLPRVYQARVSVMIMPSRMQVMLSPTQVFLDVPQGASAQAQSDAQQKYAPTISIATHKELLRSTEVLDAVINELSLADRSGNRLTVDSLLKKLGIEDVEGTNILLLTARDTEPGTARDIVNAWARIYTGYSQALIADEVGGRGTFIDEQFEAVRDSLIAAEQAVIDFKNRHKLDLMRAELDIKKAALNSYKKELVESQVMAAVQEKQLAELRKQMSGQEPFIIVSKAITDDALWQKSGRELSGLDDKKLRSEVINPLYRDLETRIVNTEVELNTLRLKMEHLRSAQAAMEKEIDTLAKSIHEKEFEFTQLNRQVDIHKRPYEILSSRIEEGRIIRAAHLGEVRVASAALEPGYPVTKKKKRIVALAGILSMMFGVFMAFVAEARQKAHS